MRRALRFSGVFFFFFDLEPFFLYGIEEGLAVVEDLLDWYG